MTKAKGILIATVAAALGFSLIAADAEAARRSKGKSQGPACYGMIDGQGSGRGVAGKGSQNARQNAINDWATKVERRYGAAYANYNRARGTRFDCRSGVLEAKCVVTARPCR